MNDWGGGEGVLGCDACSGVEGSVLRGGWGYIRFGMGFVVVVFVDYFLSDNNK